MENDRRLHQRHAIHREAVAILDGTTVSCRIRNLGEGSAGIFVPRDAVLPERFQLWICRDRVLMEVRTIWRAGEFMGVRSDTAISFDLAGRGPAIEFKASGEHARQDSSASRKNL